MGKKANALLDHINKALNTSSALDEILTHLKDQAAESPFHGTIMICEDDVDEMIVHFDQLVGELRSCYANQS